MNVVAFDTETKGFDWWADETAFLGTLAWEDTERAYDLSDEAQVAAFCSALDAADVIVAHNLKFDAHQLLATLGCDLLRSDAELHCTDLMSHIYWPEGSYGEHGGFSLKNLAKVYIDPEADIEEKGMKEAGKAIGYRTLNKTGAYYDVWRAYPEVVEAYALKDARYTWDLFALLQGEQGKDDRLDALYAMERQVLPLLIRSEREGCAVDQPAVKSLHKAYKAAEFQSRLDLEDELGSMALGGEGSEDALVEALQKQGVPLKERTDSGKLATNKFALQVFEDDYPIINKYLEYRRIEKFLSTYIEPLLDQDVVHMSFGQIGTWTGRMACKRPNMQNIPVRAGSEVREVFIARPGFKLAVADYEGIEARLLAHYLGSEGQPYRDLFAEGLDPHAWMAASIWGGDPDEYAKGSVNAAFRQDAKSILFAIIYGAGGCRLCKMLNLDEGPPLKAGDWEIGHTDKVVGDPSCAKGKALARKVKAAIPGYAKLMRRVKDKIELTGYVTTLGGRKSAISREKSYVGMSGLIQGSAADCIKEGVLAANALVASAGIPFNIRMLVHDEVGIEAPEDRAHEALALLQEGMESVAAKYELTVDLPTSGVVCDNYGEAK